MPKKYFSADSPTIITNDLFLAAFLHTAGCSLARIEKNERRRVSFVFIGEKVRELREAYRTGPVRVDMTAFRDNLNRLRDRLGETITGHIPEERSASYVRTRSLNTQHRQGLQTVAHG
jgi:Domain of unknown function (DUF5659)